MAGETTQLSAKPSGEAIRPVFQAGDLVTSVTGYPILYEILSLEPDGLLRVRGNNWASGYSAIIRRREVRPVTGILSR